MTLLKTTPGTAEETIARVPNALFDQTLPEDRQILVFSENLSRVKFVDQADVVFNSLNFSGCDPAGVTSSGAALALAVEACLPPLTGAQTPANTTRNATRRLHVPPGTFMCDTGEPVLATRSTQGFNLRTGGPYATKFVQAADSRAIVEFNGISRSEIGSFSMATSGAVTVDIGCHIFWDNLGTSPSGQAARSTLETHFDFIESTGARCIRHMQIGRDGDNNQVDSLSFGHVMLQGSAHKGFGISDGTNVLNSVTGGPFIDGQDIQGGNIVAGTTIVSGGGTSSLTLSATVPTSAGVTTSLHAVLPGLDAEMLRIGHAVSANNLLHMFGYLATMSGRIGVYSANSGFAISKWQPQANGIDLYFSGAPNGEVKIMSGRSENSQRFMDGAGATSAAAFVTIEDMKFAGGAIASDGEWVRYFLPGILRMNNIYIMSTKTAVTPVIKLSPSRRLKYRAAVSTDSAEATAFSFNAAVAPEITYVETASAAVPAATHAPDVASTAALALPFASKIVTVSGTANITSITAAGHAGRTVKLIFTGTASGTGLTDGSNLKLAGNLVYTPDDSITLSCPEGVTWYEDSRSVN